MTATRIVLCVGLVFSVVLHLEGDQLTTTGSDAVAYLSTEEAAQVDAVIQDYVSVTQARIVADQKLERNIALLKAGEKGDFSWTPPMRIGWCAKYCRDAFVPIPESIDDSVVDAIVALGDDAGGTTESDRRYIRGEVARALGFIGNKRALDTVLHIIETQGGTFAWQGLPDIADERIIPFIREHFASSPPPVAALERVGPQAIPLLADFIERADRDTYRALRKRAVEALLAIQSVEALPILDSLKDDPDNLVRRKAIAAARIIRSREIDRVFVIPRFDAESQRRLNCLAQFAFRPFPTGKLQDWSPDYVNAPVREVLVSLGRKALPVLRTLLASYAHGDGPRGPVWTITPKVAQMLVEIGPPSIPALIDALNDEQTHVYPFAAQALHTLTGQNFGTDYEKWRDWWLASQAGEHMPVVEGKPEGQ